MACAVNSENNVYEGEVVDTESSGRKRRCLLSKLDVTVLLGIPLLSAASVGIVFFPLKAPQKTSEATRDQVFACDANGNVYWTTKPPGLFDTRFAFAINLGFGSFSFSVAKSLDLAWDLVIGRVGQALFISFTYITFKRALTTSRRAYEISYEKFLALTYAPSNLMAFLTYLDDFVRPSGSFRQFLMALAVVYCTVYVLIFPTWVSAMTGYQAQLKPFESETKVAMNNVPICGYFAYDSLDNLVDCAERSQNMSALTGVVYNTSILGQTQEGPNGQQVRLSGFSKSSNDDPYFILEGAKHPLSPTEMLGRGLCQPAVQHPNYQWGFSSLLLLIFLGVTFLILATLYFIWIDTLRLGYADNVEDIFGPLRAAFALSKVIKQEIGDNAAHATEQQLQRLLEEKSAGLRIEPRMFDETAFLGDRAITIQLSTTIIRRSRSEIKGRGASACHRM
ncbi:hypothetical protein HII31_07433 [Pseudocercospora fuligena]|uniref:Uncharacterized protein n=1 Tax=Pseudocercospora fuligena TaxID=685502 RepID=A0A8H6VH77_9PEZI|nr:hypothetical protein HII31_07433 [Pseudocercospora fuligena]